MGIFEPKSGIVQQENLKVSTNIPQKLSGHPHPSSQNPWSSARLHFVDIIPRISHQCRVQTQCGRARDPQSSLPCWICPSLPLESKAALRLSHKSKILKFPGDGAAGGEQLWAHPHQSQIPQRNVEIPGVWAAQGSIIPGFPLIPCS